MFAVVVGPKYYKDIEQVINSKGDEILYKVIDTDVDINSEIEKINRITVKHLIIDITCLERETDLAQAVRNYRIRNEHTQIIIIAQNYIPGNETLSLLVTMGVYDILAPQDSDNIGPLLLEILDKPTSYSKAVKWDIGVKIQNSKEDKEVKTKVEYIEKIESVFKKVIVVYSPTSEGASRIASHLAHAIVTFKKCKVLLIDFNPLKPVQREIFDMKFDYSLSNALDAVVKRSLNNIVLESYTKESKYNKNLHILCGLYDINDFYNANRPEYFEEIIEKARFSYDYVIIDTHSWYDVITTDRALYLSDVVIVPVRGRNYSLDTVTRYLKGFEKYNDFDIRKFNIVINKYSGDDLTFLEIESKLNYPVIGYISEYKDYDKLNGFRNSKLIDEYIPILNKIDIKVNKKTNIFSSIANLISLKRENKGGKDKEQLDIN